MDQDIDLVSLTGDIVSAYVGNNTVHIGDLPTLISSVHSGLVGLGAPVAPAVEKPIPPVSIKKSVADDYIVSMEDGRRYKSLKRHLSGRGLTPEQYREKWSLPIDYPMVAPSYARQRSELAKSMGLGRKAAVEPAPAPAPAPKKSGGKKKGGSKPKPAPVETETETEETTADNIGDIDAAALGEV